MLLLDAHIHIYPEYDLSLAWQALRDHADEIDPEAELGFVLADREGQDHIAAWTDRAPDGVTDVEVADRTAVRLTFEGGRRCWAFAGRQIAARERIEALGMLCRDAGPDGPSGLQQSCQLVGPAAQRLLVDRRDVAGHGEVRATRRRAIW